MINLFKTKYRVVSHINYEGCILYSLQVRYFFIWMTKIYGYVAPERAIARANEYIAIEQRKKDNKKHEGRVIWSN